MTDESQARKDVAKNGNLQTKPKYKRRSIDDNSFNENVALARERNPHYREVILSIEESQCFLSELECPDCCNRPHGRPLLLYGTMHGRFVQERDVGPGPFYPEPEEARHIDFFECTFDEIRFYLQYKDRQLVIPLAEPKQ